MDKLAMETKDITNENIEKILELFPNVATEGVNEDGKLVRAIDFEKLKQELSHNVIDGEESYDFTWVGKKEAMLEANRPIRKTLRPDIDSSVNWDTTENIYIEGDNLDALKLLQESYLGKVKMIYIDPPYNTGKDFVYRDNFTQDKESYKEELGIKDEEGNKLFQNTESNGRFHSDWCSMIYPRLKLARNLLSDDGAVFISIDDNEIRNLKNICDEIFGENNFLSDFVWQKNFAPKNDNKYISVSTENIIVYCKNKISYNRGLLPRTEKHNKGYSNPDNDIRGLWTSGSILATTFSSSGVFEIEAYNGSVHVPPAGRCWRFSQDKIKELKRDNRLWFGSDGNGVPRIKRFLSEMPNGVVPQNLLLYQEVGSNQDGTQELKSIFNAQIFDFPKGTKLLKHFAIIGNLKDNDIILDFFSGSATTAHAVMQMNAEDGGNRKFILVQLPEKTDEKSEAYKAGYKNICEIGEERIRRAGKKIQEENPDKKLDIGFRVFKVDDTNMKDVYYSPQEYTQTNLGYLEQNIKDDRSAEDLLYEVLLNSGVELSLPHKVEIIDGARVHFIQSNYSSTPDLIACFEDKVPETLVRTIAQYKPTKVVFRDSCFRGDSNKINIEEIFKLITPDTRVKVL